VLGTKTLVAFSDLNSSVLLPVAHTYIYIYIYIYIGKTNNRLMLIKDFQGDGDIPLILLSLASSISMVLCVHPLPFVVFAILVPTKGLILKKKRIFNFSSFL